MKRRASILVGQLAHLGWLPPEIERLESTLEAQAEGIELRRTARRPTAEDFFFCVFRTLEKGRWGR